MKKLLLLTLAMALTLIGSIQVSAQNMSVKVNVVDSYGPVAGASVMVKGTTNGQATDLDGNASADVHFNPNGSAAAIEGMICGLSKI